MEGEALVGTNSDDEESKREKRRKDEEYRSMNVRSKEKSRQPCLGVDRCGLCWGHTDSTDLWMRIAALIKGMMRSCKPRSWLLCV